MADSTSPLTNDGAAPVSNISPREAKFSARLSRLLPRLAGQSTEAILTRMVGGTFIVNFLGMALAFVLQIVLARLLGARDFGQYMLVITWINLLLLVAKLGLDTAALRFLPEYAARGQWALLRGFLRRSTHAGLTVSVVIAAVVASIVFMFSHRLEPGLAPVFYIGALLLPVTTFVSLQAAQLQAFKKIVWSQASQNILRPLLLMTFLGVVVIFSGHSLSAAEVMALSLVAVVITSVTLAWSRRQLLPGMLFQGERDYHDGLWTGVAIPMLLITSFNMILNQADIILVGTLLTSQDAGVYAAASRIVTLIPFAIVLVNSITSPLIAELHAQGRLHDLQRMTTRVAWGSLLVSTPLCLAIVFMAPFLLGLFGAEFVSGSASLIILAVSRLVIALTGSVGYLMSMTGHHRPAAIILGIGVAANIILDLLLIPPFGLEGAAVASVISTVLWCMAMVLYARRHIGINATVFPFLNPARM